jgi:hypothetical protein
LIVPAAAHWQSHCVALFSASDKQAKQHVAMLVGELKTNNSPCLSKSSTKLPYEVRSLDENRSNSLDEGARQRPTHVH